jgi:carboxypeptidase PM20D1
LLLLRLLLLCLFAQVRMTVSPTIIQAGVALNVLPQHAVVKVNARLLPGQTQEDLVKYMQSSAAG